jgi:hypothetical protein
MTKKISIFHIFILFLVVQLFTFHIKSKGFTPTGDEPHYLVMMDSFIKQHTLKITEESYELVKKKWIPRTADGKIQAHLLNVDGSKIVPLHQWGLPILLSPVYLIDGYRSVSIFLCIIMFLAMKLLLDCAINMRYISKDKANPIFAISIFTMPFFSFAGEIYPEVIAFLTLSITFYFYAKNLSQFNKYLLSISSIVITSMTNIKFIVLFIPVYFFLFFRKEIKNFLIVIIFSALILLIFNYLIYNIYYKSSFLAFLNAYRLGSGSYLTNLYSSFLHIFRNCFITIMDQRLGILFICPLILVILSAFKNKKKNNRKIFIDKYFFYSIILFLLEILSLVTVWPGTAPIGRFFLPIFPLIYLLIFKGLENLWIENKFPYFLVFLSLFLTFGSILKPNVVYPDSNIPNGYLYFILGLENSSKYIHLFPSFDISIYNIKSFNMSDRIEVLKSIIYFYLICSLYYFFYVKKDKIHLKDRNYFKKY